MLEKKQYLNLGCGNSPIPCTEEVNVVNVDMGNLEDERILHFDITKSPYPFVDKHFNRIYVLHTIEHLPKSVHGSFLLELRRILKDEGELVIAYPEFKKCAQNYIDNKDQDRDFWEATIFGRGRDTWDTHKALMDTDSFAEFTGKIGLSLLLASPELNQPFNTVCILAKCQPTLTYEELLQSEFCDVAIRP